MIKITFKKPFKCEIEKFPYEAMFILFHRIEKFGNVINGYVSDKKYICFPNDENIKSIEHIKPTDL